MKARPTLAVTLGDPAGIGPEVVLGALSNPEVQAAARLVLIGHPELRASIGRSMGGAWLRDGCVALGARDLPEDSQTTHPATRALAERVAASLPSRRADHAWIDVLSPGDPGDWSTPRPQASAGRAALAALRVGACLAQAGVVDGLVTAPVSKEALHLAGEVCEGQTELLGRWAGTPKLEMLAIAGRMRVLLLTRHMPLKTALAQLTSERVLHHLRLLDGGLRSLGCASPHLALAGLNPHAGEAGLLGREELDLLAPALEEAGRAGLRVTGPESPDTVFLRASRGEFDGVLALYHDQAFIPVKLHAPEDGLTVLLGLPYLRVSPAHGTAFDIAGQGKARARNMITAILQAAQWAPSWRTR